jgi:hypothetical protein
MQRLSRETPVVGAALPLDTVILDGEVCTFDANLVSHMHLLQPEPGVLATPPTFVAFDCVLLGGVTRGETYDQHAAEVFGALADAGVESKAVQHLVRDFETMTVSNVGGALSDAQLDALYRRHVAALGEKTAKALLGYYKTSIRGDRP